MPLAEVVLRSTVSAPARSRRIAEGVFQDDGDRADTIPAVSVCGARGESQLAGRRRFDRFAACVAGGDGDRRVSNDRHRRRSGGVSWYSKLTVLAPAAMVSGDAGVNVPLPDVVLRVTDRALAVSTDCRTNQPKRQ